MRKKTNLILIGFMGSGKTTLGTALARETERAFADTDELIESQEHRLIKDIFSQEGEEYFRDLETEMLQKLIETTDHTIISVGGGLPVRERNRTLMRELGTVIYLKADPEVLEERLRGDDTRPMLKGADLHERILALMEKREALYQDASDVILETGDKNIEEVCELLKKYLK